MIRVIVAAALLASPALAVAQKIPGDENGPRAQAAPAQTGNTPQRIRDVQLAPGQPCPKASSADEVVVCRPLEDPYRIPKALRDTGPVPAKNQSWVNRAQTVDDVSRRAGGLPDTCSPIGSGGQTGCEMQQLQQWTAEQRQKRQDDAEVPQ
jgi:hypothetical protein